MCTASASRVPGVIPTQVASLKRWSRSPLAVSLAAVALPLGTGDSLQAQRIPLARQTFNEFSLRAFGQPVVPIFDGWFENSDGSKTICFGYKNLNLEEALDIPLGPDNFIVPSEFDGAQPTHFAPAPESLDPDDPKARYRRQYCVLPIRVPQDFDEEVVWTLRAQGETITNPGNLLQAYVVDEPVSDGRGAQAPVMRIGEDGPQTRGRNGVTVGPYRARVGEPLTLSVSVQHPDERVWIGWFHYQGLGQVSFRESELWAEGPTKTASTTVTFSNPGEYVLLVQAINTVADFEFICCWTNGYVRVTVEGS